MSLSLVETRTKSLERLHTIPHPQVSLSQEKPVQDLLQQLKGVFHGPSFRY
jgi:hypothetical protein